MNESDRSFGANPANPAEPLAPLAELADGPPPPPPLTVRDQQGRFITGNSGGGRPKGARNRLTDVLLSAIVDDFAEHGATAIAHVRTSDPATYLKLVAALVPPQMVVRSELEPILDYAMLTFEEAEKLAEAERRRKLIRRAIEGY